MSIEEKHEKKKAFFTGEFRKRLGRDSFRNNKTKLIWKENHPSLRSNELTSLCRVHSLTNNSIRSNKLGEHEGIIERVTETKTSGKGKEFYLLHRPVIPESTESTKIGIVYDTSTKPNKDSVYLNECLKTGPPLQNSLSNILIRSRFRPILLCGDIEKPSYRLGYENLNEMY